MDAFFSKHDLEEVKSDYFISKNLSQSTNLTGKSTGRLRAAPKQDRLDATTKEKFARCMLSRAS